MMIVICMEVYVSLSEGLSPVVSINVTKLLFDLRIPLRSLCYVWRLYAHAVTTVTLRRRKLEKNKS